MGEKTDVISEQLSQIGKGERIDDDPANGQHRYLENQIAINGPETVSNDTDSWELLDRWWLACQPYFKKTGEPGFDSS